MSDIFLSYASADRARVKPLVEALGQQGWTVWWDRTILPGKTWDQVIEAALAEARCVIVLWSRDSIQSDWVRTEADEAKRRGILVPALLDDVNIPLAFRRIQAANLVGWAGELPNAGIEQLFDAISRILFESAPAAAASSPPPLGRPAADSTAAIDELIGHSHERLLNAPWDPLLHPVSLSEGQAADAERHADTKEFKAKPQLREGDTETARKVEESPLLRAPLLQALFSKPDRKIVRPWDLRSVWSAYGVMKIDWQINRLRLIEQEGEYTGDGHLTRDALRTYIKELEGERANARAGGLWRRGSSTEEIDKQLAEARKMLGDMDEVSVDAIDYLDKQLKGFPDHQRRLVVELLMKDDANADGQINQFIIDNARSRYYMMPDGSARKEKALEDINELAKKLGFD